jgi:hypothetical protein
MKKYIIAALVLICSLSAKAQFANTDTLRAFINHWIRNSAVEAFQNLRLNTALIGMTNFLDNSYGGQVSNFVAVNDSTARLITVGSDTFSIFLRGNGITALRRRPGTDSVEYLKNGAGWTFAYKDSTGGGGATLTNIGSGYRWVATPGGNIKTAVYGYGVNGDSTTNANAITVQADTTETNHLVTQSDLNDAVGGIVQYDLNDDTTKRYMPLLVYGGESNGAGVLSNAGLSGAETSAFPRIQILNNLNRKFEPLQIGTNNSYLINSSNTHGWELQLMKSMQAGSPFLSDTVYLVKIAYAGANITQLATTYIDTAYARMDSAIIQMKRRGLMPQIYCWYSQGINDGGADATEWLKKTLAYITALRTRYGFFPVYMTNLPTTSAGNNKNATINLMHYWDGFVNRFDGSALSTSDGTHWDSTAMATIAKGLLSLCRDTTGQRDMYIQSQSNVTKGYTEATYLNVDNDVAIGAAGNAGGALALGGIQSFVNDNTGIKMYGGYLAIYKSAGSAGRIGYADGQSLVFAKSNQSSNIAPTDTYTNIMELASTGQAKLNIYTGSTFSTADTSYPALVVDGSGNVLKRSGTSGGITSINSQTGPAITFTGGIGTYTSAPSANTIAYNVDPTSDIFTRTIDAIMTTAQNTGTSETDLFTKTIASGTLNADKQTLNFEIDGELNDATATAQLKLHFAGNVTLNTGAINISTANTAWKVTGYLMRTSSTTAHVTYRLEALGLATPVFLGYSNLTGLDFTTTNVFKITAQAGGAGGGTADITAHSWQVLYKPAP